MSNIKPPTNPVVKEMSHSEYQNDLDNRILGTQMAIDDIRYRMEDFQREPYKYPNFNPDEAQEVIEGYERHILSLVRMLYRSKREMLSEKARLH